MRRRRVIPGLTALVTGAAGCSRTPRPTPQPPEPVPTASPETPSGPALTVTTFATRESEDGNLAVDLTVSNPADRSREAQLRVIASTEATSRSAVANLSLAPGASRDLTVTVPLSYREWEGADGSLDFSFQYR
ncbi:MAG: hypothetical protein ABEJ30_06265 [Halorientalis sp.]